MHDENNLRFTQSWKAEFDWVVAEGGLIGVDASSILSDADLGGKRFILCDKDLGMDA